MNAPESRDTWFFGGTTLGGFLGGEFISRCGRLSVTELIGVGITTQSLVSNQNVMS